MRQKAGNVR